MPAKLAEETQAVIKARSYYAKMSEKDINRITARLKDLGLDKKYDLSGKNQLVLAVGEAQKMIGDKKPDYKWGTQTEKRYQANLKKELERELAEGRAAFLAARIVKVPQAKVQPRKTEPPVIELGVTAAPGALRTSEKGSYKITLELDIKGTKYYADVLSNGPYNSLTQLERASVNARVVQAARIRDAYGHELSVNDWNYVKGSEATKINIKFYKEKKI